jgi:ubiquinone/menaquinone biosynthesis C-methylase UbiE
MYKHLDPSLEKYYSLGKERDRLESAVLEKDRTLRILNKELPAPPARILDVGGAYGVYSFPLAEQGHEVHLIDPISIHIEQAKKYANNFPGVHLASCSLGDARKLEHKSCSADAILLFGPLYHLVSREDRLQALNEAYRVLKKGGILFTSAISKFQSYIDNMHKEMLLPKINQVKEDFATGLHWSDNSKMTLFFHHPNELREELMTKGPFGMKV